MAIDLETEWLRLRGIRLRRFSGWCMELADEVGQWLRSEGRASTLLWIGPTRPGQHLEASYPISPPKRWSHHAVLLVDGKIHDAWRGEPLAPAAYFAETFPGQRICVEHRPNDFMGDLVLVETWLGGRRLAARKPG